MRAIKWNTFILQRYKVYPNGVSLTKKNDIFMWEQWGRWARTACSFLRDNLTKKQCNYKVKLPLIVWTVHTATCIRRTVWACLLWAQIWQLCLTLYKQYKSPTHAQYLASISPVLDMKHVGSSKPHLGKGQFKELIKKRVKTSEDQRGASGLNVQSKGSLHNGWHNTAHCQDSFPNVEHRVALKAL